MADNLMRIMWCESPNEVELRHREVFEVGDEDVLIKVAYTGICPWDVRAFTGLKQSVKFPRVLGHESSGYVAAVGKKVKSFEVGQPVVPDYIVKCGVCKACRTGRENRCSNPQYMQFGGGFADYVRIPQKNVYPLQSGTSMKAAAFTEPLACVVRGQTGLHLYPGEVELVVGTGPIGLMHMQVARAFGARVIVSDPIPERLEKAQTLGADWIVNPKETNLEEYIKEVTHGWGVDVAVVTVGSARVVEQTIPLLAPGGRLNIFAGIYPKDEIRVDPNIIHYGEYVITGSADSTPKDFYHALNLIQTKQVDTESLISHVFPLEDLRQGFDVVKNQQGMKVMIKVNGEAQ